MLVWDEAKKLHTLGKCSPSITGLVLTKSNVELEADISEIYNTWISNNGLKYTLYCYVNSKSAVSEEMIYKLLLLADGIEAPPNWKKIATK